MITDNHIMHAEVFITFPISNSHKQKMAKYHRASTALRHSIPPSAVNTHSRLNEPSEGPLCLDTKDSHLQDNGLWKA